MDRYFSYHYIISEYSYLKNGDFVPDARDAFQFGDSMRMSRTEIEKELKKVG